MSRASLPDFSNNFIAILMLELCDTHRTINLSRSESFPWDSSERENVIFDAFLRFFLGTNIELKTRIFLFEMKLLLITKRDTWMQNTFHPLFKTKRDDSFHRKLHNCLWPERRMEIIRLWDFSMTCVDGFWMTRWKLNSRKLQQFISSPRSSFISRSSERNSLVIHYPQARTMNKAVSIKTPSLPTAKVG